MIIDFTLFFTAITQRNGKTKLKQVTGIQDSVYRLLYAHGFRVCKLAGRKVYYRKLANEILPVTIHEIKGTFEKFLNPGKFTNIPKDVSYQSIMDWYYSSDPIKENALLAEILWETPDEVDSHRYLMKTNGRYRLNFELHQMLLKFEEWKFYKVLDSRSTYGQKNAPLYYRPINDYKFLVFNHWNMNTKHSQGFDTWEVIYKDEKDIGAQRPIERRVVRLGFQLERDFPLIEQYIIIGDVATPTNQVKSSQ